MRALLLLAPLLLVACNRGQEQSNGDSSEGLPETVVETQWAGTGRDRLCLKNERAGFITYASEGETNCALRGAGERSGDKLRIRPDGDSACVVEAQFEGESIRLDPVSPACAYYCGPKASYAGASFTMKTGMSPAADLAGDPLC